MARSHVTSHVLDAAAGMPAAGVKVELAAAVEGGWSVVGTGVTDADGRVSGLGPERLEAGVYQVRFATGEYFAARSVATFYPSVEITFEIADADQHYHVPVLLSPFGYSTYRGS